MQGVGTESSKVALFESQDGDRGVLTVQVLDR